MSIIKVHQRGNFNHTEKMLHAASGYRYDAKLHEYAMRGVNALESVTPVDTGETARSWGYKIEKDREGIRIYFTNDNIVNGIPIAILIQYGHATGTGGYVEGRDYINPVIQPLFDEIAEEIWREVTPR